MQALDELVARWRKNPDSESTLALCAHLGTSDEAELMREVGNTAEAWHRDNHSVMLSVGRMYLDAGLLAEAQAAFVQAGKLAPGDAEAYRYLGEVLLRRGDAVRGERAIGRAITLGDDGSETRLWHERSIVYAGLQKRQGLTAVADEVARTAPHQASIPAPTLSPFDRDARAPKRSARRSRPPPAQARASGPRRSSAPNPLRRRGSTPPPATSELAGVKHTAQATLLMGNSPVPMPRLDAPIHPPSPFFPSDSHSPSGKTGAAAARPVAPIPKANVAFKSSPRSDAKSPRREALEQRFAGVGVNGTHANADTDAITSDPFRGTFPDSSGDELLDELPGQWGALAPEVVPPREVIPALTPEPMARTPAWQSSDPTDVNDPTPEAILLALARVGLYEANSPVVPAWEAAPRPAPRRLWVLGGALLLTASFGVGIYQYALRLQGERLAMAQATSMRIAGLLDSGSRADLQSSEADFQRLFELDSRGPEPALLWLKNRVLHTLLEDQPVSGIESAMQRARSVGIDEARLIFGRLASALAAGDLPGAGTLIEQWDERAKGDALYQLLAGVVLERAGNPEALERYTRATTLQPDLKLAHLSAARLALIQLGPVEAKPRLELAYGRLGPGPAEQVLRALYWASSPFNESSAPPLPTAESLAEAPSLLRDTASAVAGVVAQREGRPEDAASAFKLALAPVTTPAMAAWIGYRALDAGDVEVARLAALQAMHLSVLHRSSQALAARIALAEGRLEAAQDAVRGLEPSSRDAILIEAVSAYENLQGRDAVRLVSTLPIEPAASSTLRALRDSEKVILGQSRFKADPSERAADELQIWGAIIFIDLALDNGQLDAAERAIEASGWDGKLASHAPRMMRLRRYRGELDGALELAAPLLEAKQPTPRAVAEAVLAFVDGGRLAAAQSTLIDSGDAAGPLAPWLAALVEAGRGRQPSAAKELGRLDLPGKAEPLLTQVIALRALAAAKDRRAKAYHATLARRFPAQPDVLIAAKQLGIIH